MQEAIFKSIRGYMSLSLFSSEETLLGVVDRGGKYLRTPSC